MHIDKVAGIVLAGGQARRMGGVNKGAQILGSQSLAGLVLQRIRPQVSSIFFSANDFSADFVSFGYPVFSDLREGHQGPLAGIEAVMSLSKHQGWFFCTPVDTPFLPLNLVEKLSQTIREQNCLCTYPVHNDKKEPLHCLLHSSLLPGLSDFLNEGGRSIWSFLKTQGVIETIVDSDHTSFLNFNTLEELQNLNRALSPKDK